MISQASVHIVCIISITSWFISKSSLATLEAIEKKTAILLPTFGDRDTLLLKKKTGKLFKGVFKEPNESTLKQDRIHNISKVLSTLLSEYDANQRPDYGGICDLFNIIKQYFKGPATVITSNMHIRSMGPMSELNMEYSLDCYFRQKWFDKRLKYEGSFESLSLNINMLEKIWKPDTYFHNGKGSYLHTITRPNKFLRIYKEGQVYYSMRLTVKARCPMQLQNFPMDKQSCPLIFGSYSYKNNELKYEWDSKDPVSLPVDMKMSQFDLIEYPIRNGTSLFKRGAYSMLQVNFNLRRHTGYFLIQVYVPCALIVILSWVSFWINREATADRVGLGITSVLTLSTFGLDTRTDLPKVPYPTALDWFVNMCFAFVMSSILEFAGVHYFTKIGSGEVPLIEIDEDWAEERLEDNDDTLHIIAPPKDFVGGDGNDAKYFTTTALNRLRLRSPRIVAKENYNSAVNRDAFLEPNYCPKHDRYFEPNAYTITANAIPDSDEYVVKTDTDGEDDDYTDYYDSEDIETTKNNENIDRLSRILKFIKSVTDCCYQFYNCFIGSEEYRNRMRNRRTRGLGTVNSVSIIDKTSRILFPLSFALLNLFYWMMYYSERNAPFHNRNYIQKSSGM